MQQQHNKAPKFGENLRSGSFKVSCENLTLILWTQIHLGMASKHNPLLTGGFIQFWTVSILLNNDNRLDENRLDENRPDENRWSSFEVAPYILLSASGPVGSCKCPLGEPRQVLAVNYKFVGLHMTYQHI